MEMTGNFSPCGLEQKISVKFNLHRHGIIALNYIVYVIKLN